MYAFAGWTLLFITVNALLQVFGAWFYKPRMIGLFCHHFLLIFNLASLIVTKMFLERDQGKLAALSLVPSKATSSTEMDKDWTYKDDADAIQKLWVWQLVTFILCLITSNFGCFKIWNRTDLRDSQVLSLVKPSVANSAPTNTDNNNDADDREE